MAKEIVKAAGMKSNFAIAEAKVQNALAVIHQGKRYILYNPDFITRLTQVTGTRWAAVSVLAHEIGHHLYRKPGNNNTNKLSSELEADEFSGYVLEKMGATIDEAQIAMKMLATTYATRTHPGRDDRVNSIALGFKNAGGVVPENSSLNTNTAAVAKPDLPTTASGIAATIYFTATPEVDYYVTKKLNVIRVNVDQAALIGKVAKSNNTEYPYVIYDASGYTLFVNQYGNIVNEHGKLVGKMKAGGL